MIARRHLLACVLLFGTSACVELTEDLRFEADGSGTLTLAVTMDETLAAMGEPGVDGPCPPFLQASEAVQVLARAHSREDGRLHCRETVAFDAVEDLNDPDDPAHRMELVIERGLFREEHHFRQVIAPDRDGGPAIFLTESHWRFRIALPGTIVESNADHSAGSDAHWTRPLARILREGATLEAHSSRTRIDNSFVALALVAALAGGLLVWGHRAAPPASPPPSPEEDSP